MTGMRLSRSFFRARRLSFCSKSLSFNGGLGARREHRDFGRRPLRWRCGGLCVFIISSCKTAVPAHPSHLQTYTDKKKKERAEKGKVNAKQRAEELQSLRSLSGAYSKRQVLDGIASGKLKARRPTALEQLNKAKVKNRLQAS